MSAKEMAEGIRPQEITGSATAYTGAPTVNTRGEVIQGNNRSDVRYILGLDTFYASAFGILGGHLS